MDARYVKTDSVYCPHCGIKHPVDMMMREEVTCVKDRGVRHTAYYYFCGEAGAEFETHGMYLDNEARAYEAYGRNLYRDGNSK
jgi:hypothetical protein